MSGIDGTWDVVAKSPMGDQKSVTVFKSDGNSIAGSSQSLMGTITFDGGTIEGNDVSWAMELTTPMKMTLEVNATLDGDTLNGTMKMGAFGTFPLTATRQA